MLVELAESDKALAEIMETLGPRLSTRGQLTDGGQAGQYIGLSQGRRESLCRRGKGASLLLSVCAWKN